MAMKKEVETKTEIGVEETETVVVGEMEEVVGEIGLKELEMGEEEVGETAKVETE